MGIHRPSDRDGVEAEPACGADGIAQPERETSGNKRDHQNDTQELLGNEGWLMCACGFAHGDGFDETAWRARKEGCGRVIAADHAEDGVVQPLSEENEGDHGREGGEEIMQGGEERERDLRADDRSDEGDEGQAEIDGEDIACGQAVCCEDCNGGWGQGRADGERPGQAGGMGGQGAHARRPRAGGGARGGSGVGGGWERGGSKR